MGLIGKLRMLKKAHNVPTWLIILGAGAFTICANTLLVLIFCFADKLGYFWFPIVLAYMAVFILIYALIIKPREMARLRYMLGDEAFFTLYPKELKRELRLLGREQKRLEKAEKELR